MLPCWPVAFLTLGSPAEGSQVWSSRQGTVAWERVAEEIRDQSTDTGCCAEQGFRKVGPDAQLSWPARALIPLGPTWWHLMGCRSPGHPPCHGHWWSLSSWLPSPRPHNLNSLNFLLEPCQPRPSQLPQRPEGHFPPTPHSKWNPGWGPESNNTSALGK